MRPVAEAAWLGACAGALGAAADVVTSMVLPEARGVRGEVAVASVMVDVLAGILVAACMRAAWELFDEAGRRLAGFCVRCGPIARNLPAAVVVAAWLACDAAVLFAGRGIRRTGLASVGRVAFPIVGTVVVVALVRLAVASQVRLRRSGPGARAGALVGSLAVAAALLCAERNALMDPYVALRRYCEVGAVAAALFGLGVSARLRRIPGRLDGRTRVALGAVPPIVACSLPLLLPSSAARLAVATRAFVASPVTHGLRRAFDLDGDGYSPLLGGGDCNDFDGTVHPFTRDVPGDRVDQDCDGVDGWVAEPAEPAPAYGASDDAVAQLRARVRGMNALVILIDAMRFDRLQDPRARRFPHLARLWHEGVSFTRALSPASRTPLSVPALVGDAGIASGGWRLFRGMKAAGMRTGYVSVDVVIDQLHLQDQVPARLDMIAVSTEGDRSLWGGGIHVVTGEAVTARALGWIDANGAVPWMLWVHYFSTHQWEAIDSTRSIRDIAERYDAALEDDDRAVGALLDGLAARGLGDKTVVAMVADHGESVGDHGRRTHGWYLYPELVHVPLLLSVPGLAPRAVATVVPTAALTPTLLDLFAGGPAGDVDSLAPLVVGATDVADEALRPIGMHDTLQNAIAMGDRFLRFTPENNVTEMFALKNIDAARPEDLVASEPETARRLTHALVALAPSAP